MPKLTEAPDVVIAGIANGGVAFANRLTSTLESELGASLTQARVNTAFHRDDLTRRPFVTVKGETEFPVDVRDRTILLADDVIQSGRTVRAAMEEVFSLGRPKHILLAVLCDRGGRRLPIQPDATGMCIDVPHDQKIYVRLNPDGPSPDDGICQITGTSDPSA